MEQPIRQRNPHNEHEITSEQLAQETEGEHTCPDCGSDELVVSTDQGELAWEECDFIMKN